MKKIVNRLKSHIRTIGVVALVVFVALVLTNTRFGVWLLLDAIPEGDEVAVNADPRDGPIQLSEYRVAEAAFQLPDSIEQPSGISFVEGVDRFMVATDQAELFVLDSDLSTVRSRTVLSRQLLIARQGSVEATTALDADRAVVAGESSTLELWRWSADGNWYRDAEIELSGFDGEPEFSGVAYNHDADEYFLATDEDFAVLVIEANGAVLRTIDLGDDLDLKAGRDLSEFTISGLDYADGRLYVVTEAFNTIFVVDPTAGVERAIGIEGGGQLSAISIANGRAYMPVDHNWNEERPMLFVADL